MLRSQLTTADVDGDVDVTCIHHASRTPVLPLCPKNIKRHAYGASISCNCPSTSCREPASSDHLSCGAAKSLWAKLVLRARWGWGVLYISLALPSIFLTSFNPIISWTKLGSIKSVPISSYESLSSHVPVVVHSPSCDWRC